MTPAGIDNLYGQTGSYVNDVNFFMFSALGLKVETTAANSGPYSNIAFGTNSTGSALPPCIYIGAQTLGIHGITCTGNLNTPYPLGQPGIIVNAGNNSIEDAHLELFSDGIEIGNINATVSNVVISNVTGSHAMVNTVHICGPNSNNPTLFGTCLPSGTVSDVNILQTAILDPNHHTSVQDDMSGTSIEGCKSCEIPLSTAEYTLGRPLAGGYTRFASNPAYPGTSCPSYGCNSSIVPTWGVGSTQITSGTSCLTPGAVYSNISGTSGTSVYVCTYLGWEPIA